MKIFRWYGLVFGITGAIAGATDFMSEPSETLWLLYDTKAQCTLSQEIDTWGAIEFTMRAAREPKLEFYLKPNISFSEKVPVYVRTTAPNWRPGVADVSLGEFKGFRMFDGYVTGKQAWSFVGGLQKGLGLSFVYRDVEHFGDEYVRTVINPFGFNTAYRDFLTCSKNLLPYSFNDIRYVVIHFVGKSKSLTDYSYERLRRIADYLSSDPNFAEVVISVHTDSYGESEDNQKVTEAQGNVVKNFFIEKGVPAGKIVIRSFGEENQAVSNEFENQLPINRKVLIEVNTESRFNEKR